MFNRFRR